MIASRPGKKILFLYPALLRPHLEHCVWFWAFQYKQEIVDILESPVKGSERRGRETPPMSGGLIRAGTIDPKGEKAPVGSYQSIQIPSGAW